MTTVEQDEIARKLEVELNARLPDSRWEILPPHVNTRFSMQSDRPFGVFCDGARSQLKVSLHSHGHSTVELPQD